MTHYGQQDQANRGVRTRGQQFAVLQSQPYTLAPVLWTPVLL